MKRLVCPRCGGTGHALMMSMFTDEQICVYCMEREQTHPLYKKAVKAVEEEEKKGNYNFEGIGCPPELVLSKGEDK